MKYLMLAQTILTPDNIGLPTPKGGLNGVVVTAFNVVFTVLAAISVVYIVIGGIKYALSGGDSSGVKNAKETIMYAILGLVIALLAFGAVNFITTKAGGL